MKAVTSISLLAAVAMALVLVSPVETLYGQPVSIGYTVTYDGEDAANDEIVTSAARDSQQNIYVAGSSRSAMLLLKFDADGSFQWSRRYVTFEEGQSRALDVECDSSDNVYITGFSEGRGTDLDFVTIKYNSAGTRQWLARYTGESPASSDSAVDLAVDSGGNVYVTGPSGDISINQDYATIRYDSNGNEDWVVRYDGGGADEPFALTLVGTNRLAITGRSDGTTSLGDCVTVMYSTSGGQIWAERFDGAASLDDVGYAVTADSSANVLVTGSTGTTGDGTDLLVVSYSASGSLRWTYTYDGPAGSDDLGNDLVLRSSGQPVVTGTSMGSGTGLDVVTLQLTSLGAEDWVERHNGPAGLDDAGWAIAAASTDVVVGGLESTSGDGTNFVALSYDAAGNLTSSPSFDGPDSLNDSAVDVVVNTSDEIILAGSTERSNGTDDVLVAAFDSSGTMQWDTVYEGAVGGEDRFFDVATDAAGNVIAVGMMTGANGSSNFAINKYSATGTPVWDRSYDGPANGVDRAAAVVVDGTGSVYVTGTSAGTGLDIATVKYNSGGTQQWVRRYNGPQNLDDQSRLIELTPDGGVVVAGYSENNSGPWSYVVIKYTANGSEQWSERYVGPGFPYDDTIGMAVTSSGNVVLGGYAAGTGWDVLTLMYSSSGSLMWDELYDGPGGGDDSAKSVCTIGNDVYVGGYASANNNTFDALVLGYNSSGSLLWAATHDGDQSGDDWVEHIQSDGYGRVVTGGYTEGPQSQGRFLAMKYTQASELVWKQTLELAASGSAVMHSLGVGPLGNLYMGGHVVDTDANANLVAIKVSPSGQLVWEETFDGQDGFWDTANGLWVEEQGRIYAAGTSYGLERGYAGLIIQYLEDDSILATESNPGYAYEGMEVDLFARTIGTGVSSTWTQQAGETVTIQNAGSATASITAPVLSSQSQSTLRFAVTASQGGSALETRTVEVPVWMPGDASHDHSVNLIDFGYLKTSFNQSLGSAGYNAHADFNADNAVNLVDFGLMKSNFNQSLSP